MTVSEVRKSKDWLAKPLSSALAWWIPHTALFIGLLLNVPARAALWVVALSWMGIACIMNTRRCGRTHCRFTGPYYLVMIVPVLTLMTTSAGFMAWITLAVIIVAGSRLIWWLTERAWGAFS
jgi:hypothetical protein